EIACLRNSHLFGLILQAIADVADSVHENLTRGLIEFGFFFIGSAHTDIYTLSLHDALPISKPVAASSPSAIASACASPAPPSSRSEEHTSELQSQSNLVCRLLLEKKNA